MQLFKDAIIVLHLDDISFFSDLKVELLNLVVEQYLSVIIGEVVALIQIIKCFVFLLLLFAEDHVLLYEVPSLINVVDQGLDGRHHFLDLLE